jgi:PAS domain S-box-containing protein
LASNSQALGEPTKSGRKSRFRNGRARLGGIAGVFAHVRGADWPWKLAIGAALGLPWAAVRIAVFGFSPDLPYLVFYPSVAVAAALGGSVAGVGAALSSILVGTLWFTPALSADFLLRFGGFLFYTSAICVLAEAMHHALWRLGVAEGQREAAEKLVIASERFRLASAGDIGTFNLDILKNAAVETYAMRAIFGMSPKGVINPERMIGLALPEDRPKIQMALAAACDPAGDGAYEAEYCIHRENDGALRWIAARGQVHFEKGRAVRMIGVCRDVTDVKTAQQALRNRQAQILRFVEQAPIEVAMFDRAMNHVAASRRWLANNGRGRDTLVGVNHYALHPDLPERWKAVHRRVLEGEFHSDDSDVWVDEEGRKRWLRWAVFPWTDSDGAIGGVIISAEDVSAQKQAEATLRENEEKFRKAFAEAAIGFVMANAGGTIVEANAAYCRLTGHSSDELRSMRLIDLVHPEDRVDVSHRVDRIRSGEAPAFVVEHRYLRKDGEPIWVRASASMTHDPAGGPQWVVNLVEDVTERKRIQETADRTIAQLTAVLDGAKDAVISIDINGVVQSINAAGERMFGYERDEVIGRHLGLLMPEADARRHDSYVANYLKTGVGKIIGVGREVDARRKDGTTFPIDLTINEAAVFNDLIFVGFVRDLSERRRIQSRMDQLAAQRLTAIGGMAGALAHELNQPLAAIGAYLETAQRMLARTAEGRSAPVEDAIARASAQVVRMGDIIGHLRAFVGHGEPDKTYQSLHALIGKVVVEAASGGRLQAAAPALDLFAERDDVVMDPVQIGQVLSNLVRNAREAVGAAPGGQVVVSTAVEGGDTIRCDVSDNGPGLADAVRERLFEPMTSTKPTGMGVGLSISKSIVEAHYGRIWAQSNPKGGTIFSFTLPLADAEVDE